MLLSPRSEKPGGPGHSGNDFQIREPPGFRSSTQDQLPASSCPWQGPGGGARYFTALTRSSRAHGPERSSRHVLLVPAGHPARPPVWCGSCPAIRWRQDPRAAATFSGLALGGPHQLGGGSAPIRRPIGDLQASFSDFCVPARAPPLPAIEIVHIRRANSTIYPHELTIPAASASAHVAKMRRACSPPTTAWTPPEDPTPPARLPHLGSAGSAAVELRHGSSSCCRHPAPLHRQPRPAPTIRARRQHDREEFLPDVGPPPRRRGPHPWLHNT